MQIFCIDTNDSYHISGQFSVAGGPAELGLLTLYISSLDLGVLTVDLIVVGEVPDTLALRLVVVELAFVVGSVGVLPAALHDLSTLEGANVLLASLEENVGALAVLLSVLPVA